MNECSLGNWLIERTDLPLLFEQELNTIGRISFRNRLSRMECGIFVRVDDQFADIDGVFDLRAIEPQLEGILLRCAERPFGYEEAIALWSVHNNFLRGPRCIC